MTDSKSNDLITLVRSYCKSIDNGRTSKDVLKHLKSEVAELSQEIDGTGDGEDGVFGEAIDVILCALDIIHLDLVNMPTDYMIDLIVDRAELKCNKWKQKASTSSSEPNYKKIAMNLREATNEFNEAISELKKNDVHVKYDKSDDNTLSLHRIYRICVEDF